MKIQNTKKIWVAWTDTDLTEGRGIKIPSSVCELESTAIRLGKGGYVMGSDCPVTESIAVKIEGVWLAPCKIELPSIDDIANQKIKNKKKEVAEKAKKLGLTTDELKLFGL